MNIEVLLAAGFISIVPDLGSLLVMSIMLWALLLSFKDIVTGNLFGWHQFAAPLVGVIGFWLCLSTVGAQYDLSQCSCPERDSFLGIPGLLPLVM